MHIIRLLLAIAPLAVATAAAQPQPPVPDTWSHWSFAAAPKPDGEPGGQVCAMTAEPDGNTTFAIMGLHNRGMLLAVNRKDISVPAGSYPMRWMGLPGELNVTAQSDGSALMAPLNTTTDPQGLTQRLLMEAGGSSVALLQLDGSPEFVFRLSRVDRPVIQAFLYCLAGELTLTPGHTINGR